MSGPGRASAARHGFVGAMSRICGSRICKADGGSGLGNEGFLRVVQDLKESDQTPHVQSRLRERTVRRHRTPHLLRICG